LLVQEGYIYDYEGNLLVNTSATGNTVYIGGIYEKAPNGNITKYYFVNGQRIAMRKNADPPQYISDDHLGSTSLVTTSTGTLESRTRYYPYGSVRTREGVSPTDKMYTGQQRETPQTMSTT
jgi:hypothetical protein